MAISLSPSLSPSKSPSISPSISPSFALKTFEYRIFDSNTYVTTWTDEVLSEPYFRMTINGGAGEMVVRLSRTFDNFGEDNDVKLSNKVEVWCFDCEAPNGTLLYCGYISGYRPVLDGASEYVEVTLLPYIAEMSELMLREPSGDTLISFSSVDPSSVFKQIIDYYREDGGTINYTASSIDDTNTTITYNFNCYTVKEALDKAIELTPENWYWFVDANNILYLKLSNMTTATHNFYIGKHLSYMETWRRAEDLINRVYFVGGDIGGGELLYRMNDNDASIASYGIRAEKKVDQRVTSTTTADIMANRLINSRKDPEIRTTAIIVDNNGSNALLGYDIESIKPGDTMIIRNLQYGAKTITLWDIAQWDVDVWDQTLAYAAASIIQILTVEYSPNQVRIEASSRLPEIPKRMEDIYRNLEDTQVLNVGATPVVV